MYHSSGQGCSLGFIHLYIDLFPLFLFSIPLPSIANHANVLGACCVFSYWYIRNCCLCAYVEFLLLLLDLDFSSSCACIFKSVAWCHRSLGWLFKLSTVRIYPVCVFSPLLLPAASCFTVYMLYVVCTHSRSSSGPSAAHCAPLCAASDWPVGEFLWEVRPEVGSLGHRPVSFLGLFHLRTEKRWEYTISFPIFLLRAKKSGCLGGSSF